MEIKLSVGSISNLQVGSFFQLEPYVSGTEIPVAYSYQSLDESIVTVNSSGKVLGMKVGETVIVITATETGAGLENPAVAEKKIFVKVLARKTKYRVKNMGLVMVPLLLSNLAQVNLQPKDSIVVGTVTSQMRNLSTYEYACLKVEEVPEATEVPLDEENLYGEEEPDTSGGEEVVIPDTPGTSDSGSTDSGSSSSSSDSGSGTSSSTEPTSDPVDSQPTEVTYTKVWSGSGNTYNYTVTPSTGDETVNTVILGNGLTAEITDEGAGITITKVEDATEGFTIKAMTKTGTQAAIETDSNTVSLLSSSNGVSIVGFESIVADAPDSDPGTVTLVVASQP